MVAVMFAVDSQYLILHIVDHPLLVYSGHVPYDSPERKCVCKQIFTL